LGIALLYGQIVADGIIYIALSIAAFTFIVGFPIGTINLGILAGIIKGRRASHAQFDLTNYGSSLCKTSLAAANDMHNCDIENWLWACYSHQY
jgi:hypothetical protein